MALAQLLAELANVARPLTVGHLTALSNLSSAEVEELVGAWPKLPRERRGRVIEELVALAEEDWELNFEPVYRLALKDEEASVRARALEGLLESEDPRLVEPIMELLRADPAEEVRAAGAQALGKFVLLAEAGKLRPSLMERIEAALLAVLDTGGESVQVRRRALEALAARDHERLPGLIEAAYHSPERAMQVSALYAMGRSGDLRWLPALLEELASANEERRYEAAVACGELGNPRAVAALSLHVADSDPQVQWAAIAALGSIGGEEARKLLEGLRRHADEEVRLAAEEALGELTTLEAPLSFLIRPPDLPS